MEGGGPAIKGSGSPDLSGASPFHLWDGYTGEALYPYKQDIQCLINLIDPEAPDQFSEWIIFLATSKYRLPKGLKEMSVQPGVSRL